jgi:hypothetical protein
LFGYHAPGPSSGSFQLQLAGRIILERLQLADWRGAMASVL